MMEAYSVLMSVYAAEKASCLQAAMESMLHQTVPPEEFVLVCDGPLPQELEDVIAVFQQQLPQLFQIIRVPENRGLGLALQTGLQACRNELVARMDSDDIALPDRMEKQLHLLRDNRQLSVVGGQIAEFRDTPEEIIDYRKVPTTPEDICQWAKRRNPMNHMTVLMRKSSVLAVGNYQHAPGFEDYHLWVRMIADGQQLGNVDDVCCYVRVDENLYARRGGWSYFKETLKIEQLLLENRLISAPRFCQNVVIRFAGTVMIPRKLRGYLFTKFLRKKDLNQKNRIGTAQ